MSRPLFHIVVLEDNPADLHMIMQTIQEAGVACEFTVFNNGVEALAFIKGAASPVPDLMILDCNVPGMEGASVLNSVRGDTRWFHVSVFMFTASRDPADVARAEKLGADRCLMKPMDLAGFGALGHIVREWLEKNINSKISN
jgi:CheY-like chemotaxis protein